MIAGPNKTIESVIEAAGLELVMKTYVCPWVVVGITAVISEPEMVAVTTIVSSPLTKTTKIVSGSDPSTANTKDMPGAAGTPWAAVKVGNALTGNAEFVEGHDLMNAAARVKTEFKPRDVP